RLTASRGIDRPPRINQMSKRGAEGQLARRASSEQVSARDADTSRSRGGTAVLCRGAATGKDNYWGFIFSVIFLLFVFYVAGQHKLGDWLNVIIPNPANAPPFKGAGEAPSGGAGTPSQPPESQALPGAVPSPPGESAAP